MTPAQVADELARLRASVDRQNGRIDALIAGLTLMQEAMAAQTAMLRALMAAAAPDDEGSPLQELLLRLAQAVEQNTAVVERVEAKLARPEVRVEQVPRHG